MKGIKDTAFNERLDRQAEARKAALERFRARPSEDDPEVAARRAERQAIAEARAAREAERAEAQRIKAEQEAAERAAEEIRLAAERERIAAEEAAAAIERAKREVELEAERKAARDFRYAARKRRK
ncbi:MAG: hypothetical protein AVDCRST_MAG90-2444 [uncultured Microvirga sp.]|uniref:Uncharacterized protein n=1 Tax=uncultured Microvirga sp. TaxID=412392 RepID=A0A6J4M6H2_9HYPH|nr:MAG: hypothetical protein AVDCRST_MAG90-2444 [uncultured Microvirga sp.]